MGIDPFPKLCWLEKNELIVVKKNYIRHKPKYGKTILIFFS